MKSDWFMANAMAYAAYYNTTFTKELSDDEVIRRVKAMRDRNPYTESKPSDVKIDTYVKQVSIYDSLETETIEFEML